MAVFEMSDNEKMILIRDVAHDCWIGKIEPERAILVVSGIVKASAEMSSLITWLNDKREDSK